MYLFQMPPRGHSFIVMPHPHLIRLPDGHHINLEVILLPFLKVIALILQFDLVRLALVAVETEEHVGVRAGTGRVACRDSHAPNFLCRQKIIG